MTIKLGLVGTGTVGGGCIDILQKHKEDFKRHYGIDVELARVCSRDPKQAEAHGVSNLFTLDYHDIVNDPDIDIVIELIGGTTVARDVVVSALEAGKNVVTANKALMATHGEEVMHLAEKMNREIAFEASVGGGIPIIDPLKHSLISNEITSVMGIVNGTTNYMLTRMVDDNLSYDQALKEAQERGFAEADPTADVDGFDAAAKIAILASIAFNSRVTLDDVHTEGIRNITTLDLDTADDMGYVIKLLAIAHRTPDGIDVRVHPTMLPKAHQLATVNGVFNAIFVEGNMLGDSMFYGSGAGKLPTASAVAADVVDAAKNLGENLGFYWSGEKLELGDTRDDKRRFLVRVKGDAKADAAAMEALFGPVEVVDAGVAGEFGFVTGELSEAEYAERAAKTDAVLNRIRVEG